MVTYSKDLTPDQIQDIYKQQGKAANDIYYRAELAEKLDHLARVIDVRLCEKWIEEGMKFCEEKDCKWMLKSERAKHSTKAIEAAAYYWKDHQTSNHYSNFITEEQAAAAMEFAKKNKAKQDAFEASISGKINLEFVEDD